VVTLDIVDPVRLVTALLLRRRAGEKPEPE
jgi:hypothetical protein